MKLPEIVAMVTAIVVAATSIISLVMQSPTITQDTIDTTTAIIVNNNTIKIDSVSQNEVRFMFIENNITYILDINKNITKVNNVT